MIVQVSKDGEGAFGNFREIQLKFSEDDVALGEKLVTFSPLQDSLIEMASGDMIGKKKVEDLSKPFSNFNCNEIMCYIMPLNIVRGFSGSIVTNGEKLIGIVLGMLSVNKYRCRAFKVPKFNEKMKEEEDQVDALHSYLIDVQKVYYQSLEERIGLSGNVVVILSGKEIFHFLKFDEA